MSSIYCHITNATGELDKLTGLINSATKQAVPIVERDLRADKIDIVFVSAAGLVIPEYGIGGVSPGPNHIHVSFDPGSDKITLEGLVETILHEVHHCMRWRDPGYGETLSEAMVSEGLACLYEEEHRGTPPMYATIELTEQDTERAKGLLASKDYDHGEWFYGSREVSRWFGYTYGYQLCKAYAEKHNLSAVELVNTPASAILNS